MRKMDQEEETKKIIIRLSMGLIIAFIWFTITSSYYKTKDIISYQEYLESKWNNITSLNNGYFENENTYVICNQDEKEISNIKEIDSEQKYELQIPDKSDPENIKINFENYNKNLSEIIYSPNLKNSTRTTYTIYTKTDLYIGEITKVKLNLNSNDYNKII